eukprot:m.139837 g.139837  ORF g.139837 m.139837 type:complete len:513 (+) comp16660_c0_seq2:519-2057(+)
MKREVVVLGVLCLLCLAGAVVYTSRLVCNSNSAQEVQSLSAGREIREQATEKAALGDLGGLHVQRRNASNTTEPVDGSSTSCAPCAPCTPNEGCPACMTTPQPAQQPTQTPLPSPAQLQEQFYTSLSLEEMIEQRSPSKDPEWERGVRFDLSTMAFAQPDVIHRQYASFHHAATARVLQAPSPLDKQAEVRKLRWIIVQPLEGWGNMVREVVSGYIIALLSGRVLLVDWPAHINVNQFLHSPRLNLSDRALIALVRESSESVLTLNTPLIQARFPEKTPWPEVASPESTVRLLQFNSSIPLAQENFKLNPHYGALVVPLTTTSGNKAIYELLFQPTALLEEMIKPVRDELHAAEFSVSVHARTGESDHSQWASEMYWRDFVHCISETVRTASEHSVSLKIFIATDSPAMLDRIHRLPNARVVSLTGRIAHIQKDSSDEALGRIIGDWWLLGETDELIGSFLSSYSYTAQRRTGLRAYYLAADTPDDTLLSSFGLRPNKPARCKSVFPDVVAA